ncbi:dihydroxyacetone kinase subunit DhaL [Methylophilus medardicus]|uniref:Dihydroxyacetone kinase subunit L n=1 Tax=Methylophilus medardicus TaxID=2588534 RepID=A0A5B8CRG7_9PROT|nr:dihydroxyacetone kinase subunit DhaL [Methylophilus medardicus]QDC43853.1 dihydroxyacetone kinase subunit L [Methylophilus medardicus]QDC48860.1 dihydroxyacetone kinase subunit L [Methylophilus medardicus]QDC52565.1 dihydroxyacetone kinase subunit L [Methylophilus medardicus]
MINSEQLTHYVFAVRTAILANEADIECLDRDIGDGDHYINMKRGCEAIAGLGETLTKLPLVDALNSIGMKLLSTIGGASGPLFASFFIGMSKTLKVNAPDSAMHIAAAFDAGVQAIMQRGKAQAGEKTMLDVLIPVAEQFNSLAAQGKSTQEIAVILKQVASEGLESTRSMLATKGRASGLGERVIGHLDAGAKSCQVMIHAVCDQVLNDPSNQPSP